MNHCNLRLRYKIVLCSSEVQIYRVSLFSLLNIAALPKGPQFMLKYEILIILEQLQWRVSMVHHMII